jgi:hypothetical protein
MPGSTEPETSRTTAQQHQPSVNQRRDEPVPASHESGDRHAGDTPEHGHPATRPAGPTARGDAVQDMMGGPAPQGDVPDAPATQIAAADTEKDHGFRVKYVANAVPGKPDGEVDTRS